jgi:hypothetical protein
MCFAALSRLVCLLAVTALLSACSSKPVGGEIVDHANDRADGGQADGQADGGAPIDEGSSPAIPAEPEASRDLAVADPAGAAVDAADASATDDDASATSADAEPAAPSPPATEPPALDAGVPPVATDPVGPADAGAPAPPPQGPLPVLWIEVGQAIPDDSKVTGKLRIIEAHAGTPIEESASFATRPATLEAAIGIEVHGRSSSSFEKQSFGVELRDAAGKDLARPVLGMPAESDWVLYAPCYFDKSCVRNALVYQLYREFDPARWGVRWKFAEVFIDGDYRGLYLVVEKIKRDKSRLPLARPAPDPTGGDITGGYIFRRESIRGRPAMTSFTTPGTVWPQPATGGSVYIFEYPRAEVITPAQSTYLSDYVSRFESVFNTPAWADAAGGYRSWIDLDSWLDTAILTELSMNADAYRKSLYFYKQADAAGGKLFSGPAWDYDYALGNNEFREPDAGWVYRKLCCLGRAAPPTGPNNAALFYWHKIWGYYPPGDPAFHKALRCRWRALRTGALDVAHINHLIDEWVQQIAPAQRRDEARWNYIGRVTGFDVPALASYQAEVDFLRTWIAGRLTWLDSNLPGSCE